MELSSNFLKFDLPIDFNALTQKGETFSFQTDFSEFNFMWLPVFCAIWYSIRTSIQLVSEKHAGRVITILHALSMVYFGAPGLLELNKNFEYLSYPSLFASLYNSFHLRSLAFFVAYTSISFFIVDSFYVQKTYLRHHIAAIFCWILTVHHIEVSMIHAVISIGYFEFGALCVQLSRFLPNNLFCRTAAVVGYTFSRVVLCYYIGFIYYCLFAYDQSALMFWTNLIIDIGLGFLMFLNISWTISQWKLLFKFYISAPERAKSVDFFTAHQAIIGNIANKQA